MGTKRPIDAVHPSRREQVPAHSRKRQKPEGLGSKSFKKAHPVNALKSRVRDISRLLAKDDDKLPAHIRIAKERELQSTKHELEQTQAAERRSRMIVRYHQVRFFDRQKATKRLKRAKKKLKAALQDEDDTAQQLAQAEVDEAEHDINYAMYYPLDVPYSSLFPRNKADEEEETESGPAQQASKGDEKMRLLVKQCMADGRLQDLREGKLTKGTKHAAGTESRQHAPPKKKETHTEEDGDDSDGGFFE